MIVNDMTFKMGGTAGSGVEGTGRSFLKALARAGLHVFGVQDYMSRIRGGHNWYQIRVADRPIYSHEESVHILMAFLDEPPTCTIDHHLSEVVPGGCVIYDETLKVNPEDIKAKGVHPIVLPLQKWALEIGQDKQKRPVNTAAIAAACAISGFPLRHIEEIIYENFGRRKGAALADRNIAVARTAHEHVLQNYADIVANFPWKIETRERPLRMVIGGNDALCLGAIAAGCKCASGYPMTPASSILEYMAAKARKFNIIAKQTEDEIAGILFCIGTAHMGVRSMTATSGGGFCLMVEGLGLAGSTETPIVVVLAMRPGPSTGLPTRTEQGDLLFAIHASHGEFPRIVLAPGTQEQQFYTAARAFNLADKFQCPVILITDNFAAMSLRDVPQEAFDFSQIKIDRGLTLTHEDLDKWDGDGYKRYELTETGISPKAIPGHPKAVYAVTGEEHIPEGYIDWWEGAENRIQQMNKRMKKLEVAAKELNPPEVYGPEDADITLMCWGSAYGAVRETVNLLLEQGHSVNMYHFIDIHPFPDAAVPYIEKAKTLVAVENNYSGQFAKYVRMNTGRKADHFVLRYDGRPFTPDYIIRGLSPVLETVKVTG